MSVEQLEADVAVVGSGFAGSLIALALTKRGRRVVLVERGRHPRFAIGESSTPLANLLLEELADRYDLPRIRTFSKWGNAGSPSSFISPAAHSPTPTGTVDN
jgi:FADH2 O2-dependent halogenase